MLRLTRQFLVFAVEVTVARDVIAESAHVAHEFGVGLVGLCLGLDTVPVAGIPGVATKLAGFIETSGATVELPVVGATVPTAIHATVAIATNLIPATATALG